jgi:eukaryotic-like serine/threonine-protein kinase
VLEGLGRLWLQQGQPERAREPLQRALAIREEAQGASHPELEAALSALGRTHLAAGSRAEGVELLERALVLCASPRVLPHHAAQTRFALARALWEVPEGRDRARALAAQARADWARAGRKAQRRQVEAWLAAADARELRASARGGE